MQTWPTVAARVARRSTLKCALAGLFLLSTMLALPGRAAMVPTNEAGMDAIFGAGNFGVDTIDIRFNPQIELVDASLLAIDSASAWFTLIGHTFGLASEIVRMFFVDSIDWCGGNGSFAGCGSEPGNDIAIDIDFADATFGDVLYAHELGHNLDLVHVLTPGNLMRETIGVGNLDLTSAQVATALSGAFEIIQFDGGQRFIEITPILVTAAAAVPLPGALILCISAIGTLGAFGRRGEGKRYRT